MLYLCATPIGNLGDLTLRVIEALRACDAVYCEDTRQTAKLLNHLEIKKPITSCHEHNEQFRSAEVVELLKEGKNICYCSDAGMPAISDPGAILVQACIENNLDYTVLPGASAVLTAAILSGLTPQPFTFFGFLPRESKQKGQMLEKIKSMGHLCILYESPHRVQATLQALLSIVGDCQAAVLRELTKKYESVYRGSLSELIALFETEPKGECVICVLPKAEKTTASDADLDALLDELLKTMSVKDAAQIASKTLGLPKKVCYQHALDR
ncbi:MAG: 16S rRNA (cytidine(1402)-2'-O)-methyltransferase [Eubacteriales bacterium]|nr:16S rRNA (cytidine(1402)-2'-O)-methyltransferase [Eubacteriales bacterium]